MNIKLMFVVSLFSVSALAHNIPKNVDIMSPNQLFDSEQQIKKYAEMIKKEKQLGFVESNSKDSYTLHVSRMYQNAMNPTAIKRNTDLNTNLSSIPLNFKFVPVSNVETYGYGESGKFEEGKWSGITQYFKMEKSLCKLEVFNISDANAKSRLNKDTIKFLVNDKPTSTYVEGNYNSGFVYTVDWFDDKFNRTIECVNVNFDKKYMDTIISIAIKVDKSF